MRFGVCTGKDGIAPALSAGCDYLEMGFGSVADLSEEDYRALKKAVLDSGLKVEAMNSFLPGRFRLTGPQGDPDAPLPFVEAGMIRAAELGVQVVVLGSAGARNLPEGFDLHRGMEQLAEFARLAAAVALEQGITIALEPLRSAESNILHTVDEGLTVLRMAGEPEGLAVLADMYHMAEEGEDFSSIRRAEGRLVHCHIANPEGRVCPLPGDGYDYRPFFAALKDIDYKGRVSIEGNIRQPLEDLPAAMPFLREISL